MVNVDDPLSWVNGIFVAAKAGNWSLVTGFGLLFLTLVLDKVVSSALKKKIPRKYMPWIAVGLGVLAQTGLSLATGHDWVYSISGGIVAGLIASGGYSTVGKHLPLVGKKGQ